MKSEREEFVVDSPDPAPQKPADLTGWEEVRFELEDVEAPGE